MCLMLRCCDHCETKTIYETNHINQRHLPADKVTADIDFTNEPVIQ